MIGAFSFVHENRTYNCHTEALQGSQPEAWWWFTVSSDSNRYAPFRAHPRDTRSAIQTRIVEYYSNHIARRAMTDREHWARRGKSASKPK